jgi:hypothetical protein
MSDYHRLHWVSFYKQSVFSAPVFVSMNCAALDALSRLNDHDADLCFLADRCFICFKEAHYAVTCLKRGLGRLFCKRLVDPHRKCLE